MEVHHQNNQALHLCQPGFSRLQSHSCQKPNKEKGFIDIVLQVVGDQELSTTQSRDHYTSLVEGSSKKEKFILPKEGRLNALQIGLWESNSHRLLASVATEWKVEWSRVDGSHCNLPLKIIREWKFHGETGPPLWLTHLPTRVKYAHFDNLLRNPSCIMPYQGDRASARGVSCDLLAHELSILANRKQSNDLDKLHMTLALLWVATHSVDREGPFLRVSDVVPSLLNYLLKILTTDRNVSNNQLFSLLTLSLALLSGSRAGAVATGGLVKLLKTHIEQYEGGDDSIRDFLHHCAREIIKKVGTSDRWGRLACQFVFMELRENESELVEQYSVLLPSLSLGDPLPQRIIPCQWTTELASCLMQNSGIQKTSSLSYLISTLHYYTRVLEQELSKCQKSSYCLCTTNLITYYRILCACLTNPVLSPCLFALDLPRLIVAYVVHWLPSIPNLDTGTDNDPPLSPHIPPPLVTNVRRPIVPRLNLFGLAPPIVGYGIAAAGESPATTGARTLSSYRMRHNKKTPIRGGEESMMNSTIPSPHVSATSSSRDTGLSTPTPGGHSEHGIRNCLVLAAVVLGGIFLNYNDTFVPKPLYSLRDWNAMLNDVVGIPAAMALFLLTLITKARRFYGVSFVNDLTDAGQAWIGPKFLQLTKLLIGDLFSYRKSDLSERLGSGTFSSIWRLDSTDLAVKTVSLPPVLEHPVWSGLNILELDEDAIAHWYRVFSSLWVEIVCIQTFATTPLASLHVPVCRLVDFGLVQGFSKRCNKRSLAHQTSKSIGSFHQDNTSTAADEDFSVGDGLSDGLIGPYTCWLVMDRYSNNLYDWRSTMYRHVLENRISGPSFLWLCFHTYLRVIEATEALHLHHIIHFDIKCHNVLIRTPQGQGQGANVVEVLDVALTDFGEALLVPNSFSKLVHQALSDFTQQSEFIPPVEQQRNDPFNLPKVSVSTFFWTSRPLYRDRGTEIVKSPEMLLQREPRILPSMNVDGTQSPASSSISSDFISSSELPGYKADVWAVGCLLFEVVTGTFLYGGEGKEVLEKVVSPKETSPQSGGEDFRPLERRTSNASIGEDLWWCLLYLRLSGKAGLIPTKSVHRLEKVLSRCFSGHPDEQYRTSKLKSLILNMTQYSLILDPKERPTMTNVKRYIQSMIQNEVYPLLVDCL